MSSTAIEKEYISECKVLIPEILKAMGSNDKVKVRKYTTYFTNLIDEYCLDGIITKSSK